MLLSNEKNYHRNFNFNGCSRRRGRFLFMAERIFSAGGVKIIGDRQIDLKVHFRNKFGRIRAVVLGSDDYLYITTSNTDGRGEPRLGDDKIIKINPKVLRP